MDPAHRLARLEADGTRLIDVAARDLAASVPACPGWDTAKLLAHVGRVWRSIGAHVATRATEMIPGDEIESAPEGDAVVAFARTGLTEVVSAFGGVDPTTPVWTWAGDGTVAFYLRRVHQETLVHRVDAEQALGEASVVGSDDGADGVDELFTVLVAGRDHDLPSGTLHLHRTDGEGEWMLDVVDGRIDVRHEHAKGDAALRGAGDELLLAVWGRRPLDGLELFGDRAVVESWTGLR